MHHSRIVLGVLLVSMFAEFAGAPGNTASAGSLTPPGPPSPTMKPLDQVEARTPISSLPFTISAAGSYYLTQNLNYTGSGNGITVNAGPTTIDLNGFTLSGGAFGNGGITGNQDYAVKNGFISSWNSGISSISGTQQLESVTVRSCRSTGAVVGDATVTDSSFLFNTQYGIYVIGVASITGTRAGGNGVFGVYLGPRGLVDNCILDGNGNGFASGGIHMGPSGTIRHSVVTANNGAGIEFTDHTLLSENNIFNNVGSGIVSAGGDGSRIEGNSTNSNSGYGIDSNSGGNFITRNSARSNSLGAFRITGSGNVAPVEFSTITNPASNLSY